MTDSVKQQCKMPDCVLSKFFHNHNHPNCSYGNNIHTPPVNESWEKKYNDEWWKIMDKIKDVGASADSMYAKELMRELIKSLLSTARQEATLAERERIRHDLLEDDDFYAVSLEEYFDSLTSKGGTNE